MKQQLIDELKANLAFKASFTILLLVVFLGTIQFTQHQVDSRSGTFRQNIDSLAEMQNSMVFREYYNETGQKEKYEKTVDLSRRLLQQSRQNQQVALQKESVITVYAMKTVDPLYPVPCSYPVHSEKCYLYLPKEDVSYVQSTLQKVATNESLREFSSKYNLTASEEFYANYSIGDSLGKRSAGTLEALNGNRVGLKVYAANMAYLVLLGLLMTTAISATYRKIRGR